MCIKSYTISMKKVIKNNNSSLVKSDSLNRKEIIGKALYDLIEVFKEISLNEKR